MPVDVLAPPLGATVDTVVVVQWYKNDGEHVEKGEPLFAVETDKATLDVEAPASGILRQVTAARGTEVKVLSRVALIAATDEVLEPARITALPTPEPSPATIPAAPSSARASTRERTFISPRAKQLADQEHVVLETLHGTGPDGAIVERDIRAHLETRRAPTGVAGADQVAIHENAVLENIPVKGVRALIAERMLASHTQTARVTLTAEADATALVELRASLRVDGIDASYDDLFIFILAHTLREHPRLNASLTNETIQVWRAIHIGLAVDTNRGLIVPVLRDAEHKGISQVASETKALIKAAQQGKLAPDDLRGGTFTLTNLGMYGIDMFTPIINLPETAILGIGRVSAQPAIINDQVVARQKIWLSLTFDHRLVDGGPAARFLQRVAQLVERPHLLIS